MKAVWNGIVIADVPKEQLIYIEGDWYFPAETVKLDYLRKSPTTEASSWKGACRYFDVGEGDTWNDDSAFTYPEPPHAAIDTVKKDFSDYIAFQEGKGVTVSDG